MSTVEEADYENTGFATIGVVSIGLRTFTSPSDGLDLADSLPSDVKGSKPGTRAATAVLSDSDTVNSLVTSNSSSTRKISFSVLSFPVVESIELTSLSAV